MSPGTILPHPRRAAWGPGRGGARTGGIPAGSTEHLPKPPLRGTVQAARPPPFRSCIFSRSCIRRRRRGPPAELARGCGGSRGREGTGGGMRGVGGGGPGRALQGGERLSRERVQPYLDQYGSPPPSLLMPSCCAARGPCSALHTGTFLPPPPAAMRAAPSASAGSHRGGRRLPPPAEPRPRVSASRRAVPGSPAAREGAGGGRGPDPRPPSRDSLEPAARGGCTGGEGARPTGGGERFLHPSPTNLGGPGGVGLFFYFFSSSGKYSPVCKPERG